jgi:DNA-binding NarL/FixJ family response regulator
MKPTDRTTVLLVDDHAPVRQGLRTLLDKDVQIRVVGEASDGQEALAMARKLRPQVILMDISMPLINGLEATRLILAELPLTKVIVLSAQVDEEYVNRAKAVGAVGYIAKQRAAETLISAIHEVALGRILFASTGPEGPERGANKDGKVAGNEKGKADPLTAQDSALLMLVAEGIPKKQIAARHRTTIAAIERRLEVLMAKLGIQSLAKLAIYAIAAGYIQNDIKIVII